MLPPPPRTPCRLGALCALSLIVSATAHAGPDREPPTTPTDLVAETVSDTSVWLSWSPSSDNRRVRGYAILSAEGQTLATTRSTEYLLEGLAPSSEYTFDVLASDGRNDSDTASVTVTTPGSPPEEPPPEEPPPEEPPPEEPPPEEPPEEPPLGGAHPEGWSLVFGDDFDGSGSVAVGAPDSNWRFESLDDALHRSGNFGMDELGNTEVPSWRSPAGKRWSGWYDAHHELTTYREGGMLVMRGLDSGEPDPTRGGDQYFDEGVLVDYSQSKLYTSWLDTWSRRWDQTLLRQVTDRTSPDRTFRYGYFEMRFSFEEMITPGFRLSWWLMPAYRDAEGNELLASNAYDADGNDGVEIDIFEYEYFSDEKPNRIQLSLHGGAAGSDASTFDTTDIGVDLRSGFHTIGFLWEADRLVWTIDGTVVKTVTDAELIPDVYSYMIVSREMNSGVKPASWATDKDGEAIEVLPYRPSDPGLYARNVWAWRDRLENDRALIDYVRVWQP